MLTDNLPSLDRKQKALLAHREEPVIQVGNPYLNEQGEAPKLQHQGFCASPNLMGRTGKFGTGSASGRCSTSGLHSEVRAVGNFEEPTMTGLPCTDDPRTNVEVNQWTYANTMKQEVKHHISSE